MKRTLGVIVGRAGSKRLPDKHLRPLGGKPLLAWTLEAALGARSLTRLLLSTDSQRIIHLAADYGVDAPFVRPAALADDYASALDVLRHALSFCRERGEEFDSVVLLQPTSPLRTALHIDEAVALYYQSGADTITSVCSVAEHAYYQGEIVSHKIFSPLFPQEYTRARHELPATVIENGSVYVLTCSDVRNGRFYGEKVCAYPMKRCDSVDIDTLDDFLLAEFLIGRRNRSDKEKFKNSATVRA